ncbi:MAG: site-specific integrase [Anaerolineales bacterium]|nr:site-specific integrase [Anaerolineales bacterium]
MGIIKVFVKGKPRWEVSRRLPKNKLGVRRFRRLYEKKALAEKVLGKLNGAIALGELDEVLPSLVGAADIDHTIETFYAVFEAQYAKPRLTSWTRYRQSFRFILPELGHIQLREFKRGFLDAYLERRIRTVSRSTANKDIAAIKKMFSYALQTGAVLINHLAGYPTFRLQEKALRLPTLAEFRVLVDAQPTTQLSALVAVLGETGLRKSEALGLTWPQIDFRDKKVTVERTKGKKVRSIPLTDFALEKLRQLTRYVGNQNVFVYDRGSYRGKQLKRPYKAFRKAAKAVGLEWVKFHTLRHMRGTVWLQCGADIQDVRVGLGHSSITTTARYLKHTETHIDRSLREAQEKEKRKLEESLAAEVEKKGRRENGA